ncbi:BolA family protein [Pseudochelatococcus sp. G4_1912]|uniref:BolA family protein n=1 Tax=Pseudochelatococcus sp. G4_1912 TaxID=3114288 RepID=UPI0039C61E49
MSGTEISAKAPIIGKRAARMAACLTEALSPQMLEVRDESQKHFGHGGWREEGETHYDVIVIAEIFNGKSRVDRHRMINTLLSQEFELGLHALALTALTPEEATHRVP